MKPCKLIPVLALSAALFSSCSSTPDPDVPEFHATKVIDRMSGFEETPSWANGAKVMWKEQGDVIFANIMTMSGNSRPEACMNAAALAGKSQMLQYIQAAITTSGQLNEMSASSDPAYESLTAFLSQGNISGASVRDRYWEKVVSSDEAGQRVLKIRCAASIAVRSNILEKQLAEAMNPKQEGNPEIREKLLEAQKDFIENL
ncbi:MAG: hypothetical protein ACOH5I_18705 [Oligoflexus sp.]